MSGDGVGGTAELDEQVMGDLKRMWETRDPVPPTLAERILFALSLEDIEVELMRLTDDLSVLSGARSEETARTVTFTSDSLSVLVTFSDTGRSRRLDGWITAGGGVQVALREESGERLCDSDEDGRFAFDGIVPGLVQLVFRPTPGAALPLQRPVVTPAIQL